MKWNSVNRHLCLALAVVLPCALHAQTSESAGACEDKGTNGMVSALLCPEGADYDTLAAAGRQICENRIDCGAWIWTDPADVPAALPESHDELDGDAVRSALAIWVNGQEKLIVLKKQAN